MGSIALLCHNTIQNGLRAAMAGYGYLAAAVIRAPLEACFITMGQDRQLVIGTVLAAGAGFVSIPADGCAGGCLGGVRDDLVTQRIDPLVAVLISVFVLGESMTVLQIIGGVLILGFTLWNEVGHKE